ncbi:hypothetical protein [Tropicimonas sp. S265A]|uniref:hypothetical protein n=1 Tax=Tropicimonas sp. S265A TaxID=3415134 RepID=UPI003C7E0543
MKNWSLPTLLLTAAFFIAPLVADPFTGFREDQLPFPQDKPPLQPAGYAFSIWGVIYVWLLASAVFGAMRRADDPDWDDVRLPLCLSLAAGVPWLAVATQSAVAAMALIWVMAVPAMIATLRTPLTDRWWLAAPVALYAGWLTAASLVATATVLAGYGIGPGPVGLAWLGLGAALIIALNVQSRNAPFPYAVAVAWALVGVVVSALGDRPLLAAGAAAGAAIVLLVGARKGRVPT